MADRPSQGVSPLSLALLDTAFLPLAAGVLAWPVIKVRQWRNLVFVPVLGVLALANALTHAALIPAYWPQVTHLTLSSSILAWSLAYALYIGLYAPVLLRQRVDGKEG